MTNTFYRAFEDRHRGSREMIKERLSAYTPFVQPLLKVYPDAQAIDLGCGRGEWLELMGEIGYCAQGVDLDDGMLQACRQKGLQAINAEAIAHLKNLGNETQAVVSAFHVVEHIEFEQLQELVGQAMRVLKPGGLLIMETPNPENIVVATSNFYVDPSHQKPIPPLLLSFVAEHAGFFQVKTVRLQESSALATQPNVNLEDVLTGVSPDYAVVAQKIASPQVLECTEKAFNTNYGLNLAILLNRWDTRFETLVKQASQAESQSSKALAAVLQAQAQFLQEAQNAQMLAQQAQGIAMQMAAKAEHIEQTIHQQTLELNNLYSSKSWRYTAPLRWVFEQARRLRAQGLGARLKALLLKILRSISQKLQRRPEMRQRLVRLSQKTPLHPLLQRLQAKLHVLPDAMPPLLPPSTTETSSPEKLSPRAEQIYLELKSGIQKNQEAA